MVHRLTRSLERDVAGEGWQFGPWGFMEVLSLCPRRVVDRHAAQFFR
jgi:hypothetical protein